MDRGSARARPERSVPSVPSARPVSPPTTTTSTSAPLPAASVAPPALPKRTYLQRGAASDRDNGAWDASPGGELAPTSPGRAASTSPRADTPPSPGRTADGAAGLAPSPRARMLGEERPPSFVAPLPPTASTVAGRILSPRKATLARALPSAVVAEADTLPPPPRPRMGTGSASTLSRGSQAPPTVVDRSAKTVKAVYSAAPSSSSGSSSSSSSSDDELDAGARCEPVLAVDGVDGLEAGEVEPFEDSPRHGHQPLFPSEMLWGATDDSPEHGAAIVHILTWDRHPERPYGDGNDSSDGESTPSTGRLGSLCCLSCGHMNFVSATQCVQCDFAFTVSESFIQDELYDGLTAALGLDGDDGEDDTGDARLLVSDSQLSFGGADDYGSVLAPDFAAPLAPSAGAREAAEPPPVPARRAPATARRSTKTKASLLPFAADAIDGFVNEAITLTGWDPSLTLGIDEGVERYTKRGDTSFLKSSTVLQIGASALCDMLWPVGAMTKYDERLVECRVLERASADDLLAAYLVMDVPIVNRRDFVVGRCKGVHAATGASYIFARSTEHAAAPLVKGLVRGHVHMAGFVLLPLNEGVRCVYVSRVDAGGTIPSFVAAKLMRSVFRTLTGVRALVAAALAGDRSLRPPPPSRAPIKMRGLTVGKIDVELKTGRDKVANEVLTSEQSYCQSLLVLAALYVGPLLFWARSLDTPPLIVVETMEEVRVALDGISALNQALCTELELKLTNWSDEQTLGDLFHSIHRFEDAYTRYSQMYEAAVPKLALCEKNQAFVDQCKHLKKNPATQKLDLRSFLIMPVQRIPRYELLLRDLRKATPDHHKDAELITEALARVEAVNRAINEKMRRADQARKIAELSAQFVTDPELVFPFRFLVKEGVLMKQSHTTRSARKFWLFNDLLVYARIVPGTGVAMMGEKYLLNDKLSLQSIMVCDTVPTDAGDEFAFELRSTKESFLVFCASVEEKAEWMLAVTNQICQSASLKLLSVPLEQKQQQLAPTWQRNNDAVACPLCGAEFTFLSRRHHCRLCGTLTCAACSTARVVVASWGNEKQRACDPCAAKATSTASVVTRTK